LSDDAMEGVAVELNGEEHRDGVGGPGADLAGAVEVEVERTGFKLEDAGNDTGSVLKIEHEWDDFEVDEGNIGAFGGLALAFGDERAVGQRVGAVGTEAVDGARIELDSVWLALEEGALEGFEMVAEPGAPGSRDGGEVGNGVEGLPELLGWRRGGVHIVIGRLFVGEFLGAWCVVRGA
jgi:hypothetical protein